MSRGLKVILADESKFFRAIERQFLKNTPIEVIDVESCDELLAAARAERPGMIYLSCSLPGGGDSCCRAIKQDVELKELPVIMVCDQGAPDQPDRARMAGADAVLVKPLDRHDFLEVGRKFIDEIREHRQPSFFPVTFVVDGKELGGKCLDISSGGMFVECRSDIQVGAHVMLVFKLPQSNAPQMTCSGEVMWQNRKPNPTKPHYPLGLGIKFVSLPPEVYRKIAGLVSKKKT